VTIDGVSLQGITPDGAGVLVANHPPGTTVVLGVERGGVPRTLNVAVGQSGVSELH
jgi:S1-C subfamily serine protease